MIRRGDRIDNLVIEYAVKHNLNEEQTLALQEHVEAAYAVKVPAEEASAP